MTEKNATAKRQPIQPVEQVREPIENGPVPAVGPAVKLGTLSGIPGDNSGNSRKNLLGGNRLLRAQRQNMAAGIGRVQGNRRLTAVLRSIGARDAPLRAADRRMEPSRFVQRRLQRQDPSDSQENGEGPSPELLQKIAYAQTVLSKTPPLPKDQAARVGSIIGATPIYAMIIEKRKKAESIEYYSEVVKTGGSVPHLPGQALHDELELLTGQVEALDAQIQAALPELNVTDESQIVDQVEQEFPGIWVSRAKQIAISMLDEHERVVNDEMNRYATQLTPAEGSRTDSAGELKTADAALKVKYDELTAAKKAVDQAENNLYGDPDNPPEPGGMPPVPSKLKLEAIDTAREHLKTKNGEMKAELQNWGGRYPVLMSPGYKPGAFANQTPEQVDQMTGKWLMEVKDNIAETKENIEDEDIKVWDLKHIPAMTFQSLNIPPDSPLGISVNKYIEGKRSAAEALKTAYAVFQVGLALSAVGATVLGGPLAAPLILISTGFGVMDLVIDIEKYLEESAASNVSLNPAYRDISNLEPDLLPIAIDLLTLGMDIAEIPAAVRSLKGSFGALRAGRKTVQEFVEEATMTGMSKDTAERIAKRYAARGPALDEITQVMKALGDDARAAVRLEDVLAEIKKFAMPEVSDFLQLMKSDGRIVILPNDAEGATDALIRVLGEDEAHNVVSQGLLKAGGFYDPISGIIFAKGGSYGYMQSIIVHEAVHAIQHQFGKAFHGFTAEFQAFVVQRNYLNKLAQTLPSDEIRNLELGWLWKASDDEIIKYLETHPLYSHAVPDWFEVQEAVLALLENLDQLAKAGIKVNI